VMKSREGLSLCGVDGISFGILKGWDGGWRWGADG
jgi:hypothetical protein